MFKKLFFLLIMFCIFILPVSNVYAAQQLEDTEREQPKTTKEQAYTMRGTWLSFVDMEEYLKGLDKQTFEETFKLICNKLYSNGNNTIFVHVRSHNDAIYPSLIYPFSNHVFDGTYPGYDPLKEMINIAHDSGLKIHAWINPYGYRNGQISEHPELATTENIVAGVNEILDKYDIDGIHFDDYFPPIGEDQINSMVFQVHDACAVHGKVFGISPQGNIENNKAMGADIETWMSVVGYIDYIAPQIYWTDNYGDDGQTPMSTNRLKEWKKLNKINIPIYVGMALYKAGNEIDGDPGWDMQHDNLQKQSHAAKILGYNGYILYNTKSQLTPNQGQEEEIRNLLKE